MGECQHRAFRSQVCVTRMEDTGQCSADISINCSECGLPFQFLGLRPGLDLHGAACDLEALEARLAIAPKGRHPNPLQAATVGAHFDA